MDLDTTIKGLKMEMDNIERVIKEIMDIEIDDGIIFDFQFMSNIRELDQYENFRVHLQAIFGKMRIPLKIDTLQS